MPVAVPRSRNDVGGRQSGTAPRPRWTSRATVEHWRRQHATVTTRRDTAKGDGPLTVDRRTFVKGALGASGAVLLGGRRRPARPAPRLGRRFHVPAATIALPDPEKSGIEHVDPRDDGEPELRPLPRLAAPRRRPPGRAHVPATPGQRRKTYHQTQFDGCDFTDPDHSYVGGPAPVQRRARWTASSPTRPTTRFAISYYEAKDRPFMSKLARPTPPATATSAPSWPRPTPTASSSTPAQTDRLDDALTVVDPAHHLGPAQPERRAHRPLLLQRRAVHRLVGDQVHAHLLHVLPVPQRCRRRHPAQRVLRRPQVLRRGHRHLGRRPPAGRHPRRRRLPVPDLPRRGVGARAGTRPCSSSTTTSGAASSTMCRRRASPPGVADRCQPPHRRGHRPRRQGQGAHRLPGTVHHRLALHPDRRRRRPRSATTSTTTPRSSSSSNGAGASSR